MKNEIKMNEILNRTMNLKRGLIKKIFFFIFVYGNTHGFFDDTNNFYHFRLDADFITRKHYQFTVYIYLHNSFFLSVLVYVYNTHVYNVIRGWRMWKTKIKNYEKRPTVIGRHRP